MLGIYLPDNCDNFENVFNTSSSLMALKIVRVPFLGQYYTVLSSTLSSVAVVSKFVTLGQLCSIWSNNISILAFSSSRSTGPVLFKLKYEPTQFFFLVASNNAGIMATPFMLSKDKIELQFATNHLGKMNYLYIQILVGSNAFI